MKRFTRRSAVALVEPVGDKNKSDVAMAALLPGWFCAADAPVLFGPITLENWN
jgi:hypothetical protein